MLFTTGGEMKKLTSKQLTIVAVVTSIVLTGVTFYWFVATDSVSGNVQEKSISGYKEGTAVTLVGFWSDGHLSVDPAVKDLFEGQDINMTISADLEQQLRSRGYEVHYLGHIGVSSPDNVNHLTPGDATDYFLSRDDFNRLHIGENVTIEVSHNGWHEIRHVH